VDEEEGKREVEGGFDEHYPLIVVITSIITPTTIIIVLASCLIQI